MHSVESHAGESQHKKSVNGFCLVVSGYFVSPIVLMTMLVSGSNPISAGAYYTIKLLDMIMPNGFDIAAYLVLMLIWMLLFSNWLLKAWSKSSTPS